MVIPDSIAVATASAFSAPVASSRMRRDSRIVPMPCVTLCVGTSERLSKKRAFARRVESESAVR